jgi:acetyl esterase/lipase
VLSLVLAACSPRRVAERIVLGAGGIRPTTDVAYGAGPRRRLDVYQPRAAGARRAVVVFLYGGRWRSGAKRDYLLIANALTRRGWVVVVPDYRLYPAAIFPAWVEDGASAVRWTVDNIGRYGGDAGRIFVVGHSAGAHTAALLALDEHYLRTAGVPSGAVRGFVSLAGPVDTTWTDPDVQALMGPESHWPSTYPVSHVDGTEAPLLLLHGVDDETVGVGNSKRLAARIRERGGCARVGVYRGVGHIRIALALAVPSLASAPVLDDLARFVRDPRGDTCPGAGEPGVPAASATVAPPT